MKFILYHDDNQRLAEYIQKYSEINKYEFNNIATITIEKLPKTNNSSDFAKLPESLRRLLFFAKPDLVICLDDGVKPTKPIFAIELTEHVPARDHWMQRFNNLVGCAQEGIPGAYIMPFDLHNRKNFNGTIDPFFLYAYDRVMEIHQTPFYIAEWKSKTFTVPDVDNNFIDLPNHNSEPIINTINFINTVIEHSIHGRNIQELMRSRLIVNLRNELRKIAYKTIPQISDFNRLSYNMPNNSFLSMSELTNFISNLGVKMPSQLPDRIIKREKNLIFVPQIERKNKSDADLRKALNNRIKDKGGDPYLGQPLAFDYIFCRLGPTEYERDVNLIIDLSVLNFSDISDYHKLIWNKCPLQFQNLNDIKDIPKYTMYLTQGCAQVMKNFLRVYAFTADIIIFKDGVVFF